jgi:hypothetical protein
MMSSCKPLILPALLALLSGCHFLNQHSASSLRGGVNIRNETATAPGSGPVNVYVADFDLNAANIKTDPGIGGLPNQIVDSGGLLGTLGKRLPGSSMTGSAEEQAPQIVSAMAEDLITSLSEKGIRAERIASVSPPLPTAGWLIQGSFTDVDEGNRVQRSAIGFGMGATQLDIEVRISDLAGQQPTQPFIVFGTSKQASMMPGGFNPYAIAAKFRMERKATAKDIQQTADQIVAEVLKYQSKFQAQVSSRSPGR